MAGPKSAVPVSMNYDVKVLPQLSSFISFIFIYIFIFLSVLFFIGADFVVDG